MDCADPDSANDELPSAGGRRSPTSWAFMAGSKMPHEPWPAGRPVERDVAFMDLELAGASSERSAIAHGSQHVSRTGASSQVFRSGSCRQPV